MDTAHRGNNSSFQPQALVTGTFRVSGLSVAVAMMAVACSHVAARATEDEVAALEGRALAGERAAIRGLFELRPRADGVVSEMAAIALGKTIRPFPQVFLEELQQHRDPYLDGLLGNLAELADQYEEQRVELEARIVALRGVNTPALGKLRDECISHLQQCIRDIPAR